MSRSAMDAGRNLRAEKGATLDYSRPGLGLSLRVGLGSVLGIEELSIGKTRGQWIGLVAACGLLVSSAAAQYPGRVAKSDKATPVLRSVAVLEWTGEAGKPSASRLVPITVFDGEQLNDGTIYLTRPEPLALGGGTEYELQNAGKAVGIFDVSGAGELHGAWLGFGAWKPLSALETAKANGAMNTSSFYGKVDVPEDDHPVLKRKHPKGTDTDDAGAGAGSSKGTNAGGTPSSSAGSGDEKKEPVDPDRPTLKRKTSDDSSTASTAGTSGSDSSAKPVDPERPTIRRNRRPAEAGEMETSTLAPDPDRPRLKRGKPADQDSAEEPKLEGLPPTMQQWVAVSDASHRAEHPWKYTWANPDDETKMKLALEAMARTALGLDAPGAPAKPVRRAGTAKPATAKSGTAKSGATTKKVSMLPADQAEPVALEDEQFRVFELTYGATATLVLTASSPKPVVVNADQADDTDKPPVIRRGKPVASQQAVPKPSSKPAPKPGPQKYVTLIAQPDLYGGVLVLYKSVTDAGHLDETPRMRLVDAVDAMGDNRGELLFELRGSSQRQFAMYRVLRGSAEQLFATVTLP
jgi:hypothetical protein